MFSECRLCDCVAGGARREQRFFHHDAAVLKVIRSAGINGYGGKVEV